MSDCEQFEEQLKQYLTEEIDQEHLATLRRHCQTCGDCRRLAELHLDLQELGSNIPEPDAADFQRMRTQVVTEINRRGSPRSGSYWPVFGSLSFRSPVGAIVAAVIIALGGVWVGRSFGSSPWEPDRIVREMRDEATNNLSMTDTGNSRFIYSNVAFRQRGDGQLSLSFDVTRHVSVVQPPDSPLVREILVQSLLSPSQLLGSRLKAISYAENLPDPRVRDALVFTLQNDPELAVRLRAIAILSKFPRDAQIEAALLSTLKQDESVQMRLQALDYLASNEVDPAVIQETIREVELESDSAVLLHAAGYEQEQ